MPNVGTVGETSDVWSGLVEELEDTGDTTDKVGELFTTGGVGEDTAC